MCVCVCVCVCTCVFDGNLRSCFSGVCVSMQVHECRVLKLCEWFCEHLGRKKKRDRASTWDKKEVKEQKSNASIYSNIM